MKIQVTKYRLNPDRIVAGTRGSYGVEKLSFAFDDTWDVSTVSVVFYPVRGKPVKIPYLPNAEIDIPAEIMKHSGESRFVVSGVLYDDEKLKKKLVTLEGRILVEYTLDDEGGNAKKVTPDTYDVFLGEAKEYIENTLSEAVASGAFDGKDGVDGTNGKDGTNGLDGEDGKDGVGIASLIQREVSNASGGTNVWQVKLTNEQTYDFVVKNGVDGADGEKGEAFKYSDFTPAQLESLRGEQGAKGDSGVFVRETDSDTPDEEDKVEVDLTEEADEAEVYIPDSLVRDGDSVYLVCDGVKMGEPFTVKDGTNGRDFRILGYYDTLSALQTAVPNPETGDMYGVGTEGAYSIYVYDGAKGAWIDNGSIAGVAGADGVDGEDGVGIESLEQTTTSTTSGGINVWQATLTNGEVKLFVVTNGIDGATGLPGTDGKNGVDGTNGVDGKDGVGIKTMSQTTTATESGGDNVWCATLTDGSKYYFSVKNGVNGTNGTNGTDGVGISKMEQTSIGSNGSASNWKATMTDGTTYTFSVMSGTNGRNGTNGTNGTDGEDGYTPVRGTDYWTDSDKEEIINSVLEHFTDVTEVAL